MLSLTLEPDSNKTVMDSVTYDNIGKISHTYMEHVIYRNVFVLVVRASIPVDLESRNTIRFPDGRTSFGPRTPSIEIPAEAILNQTERRG